MKQGVVSVFAAFVCGGLLDASAVESFSVSCRQREIPEAGYVKEMVINADQLELSFIPPVYWRTASEANGLRWTWASRDSTALLSLSVRVDPKQTAVPPNVDAMRKVVLDRYPESRVVEQFRCYSAGGQGQTFDLEQPVDLTLKRFIRVAQVQFQGGAVEFTLVTSKTAFPEYRHAMTGLMNSFRVAVPPKKPSVAKK